MNVAYITGVTYISNLVLEVHRMPKIDIQDFYQHFQKKAIKYKTKIKRGYSPYRVIYCPDCGSEQPAFSPFQYERITGGVRPSSSICSRCGFYYAKRKANELDDVREQVYELDNYECVYCGSENRLSIDHVVARTKGGDKSLNNLVTCCFSCNVLKSNKKVSWPMQYGRFKDR